MPTYNEQKGQGVFQPVLAQSGSTGDPGRTVPGGEVGGAASAVSGVSDILGILARQPLDPEHDSEELAGNKADLESLLTGELSLIAGQPITGGIVPGSREEIARVAAGYQQGRIGRDELNVRLASIVQRYVSSDPRNAQEYREIARTALGYQPSAQIAADELADLQFKETQQREITRDDADYARQQYGYVIFDQFGGVDVEATAEAGRELRAQDAEFRRLKEKADLLKTQAEANKARRLTKDERDRAEYSTLSNTVTPLIESHMDALYQATSALNSGNFGAMSETEWLEATSAEINARRNAVIQLANEAAIQGQFSNEVRKDYIDTVTASFDEFSSLMTGDRSTFATNKAILDDIGVRDKRELREIAPALSRANAALGPEITGSIVNSVSFDPDIRGNLRTSLSSEVAKVLGTTTDVVSGDKQVSDLASEDRKPTVKGMFQIVDNVSRRPQRATEEQRQSYLMANARLIDAALNVTNVPDRSKATQRLSKEGNLAAIEALSANDFDAQQVGAQLRNLNTRALLESARRIEPGTTANQLLSPVLTLRSRPGITFFPVFDPETNRIEIYGSKMGGELKPTSGERLPPFLEQEVEKMNKNLDVIVRFKAMGDSDIAGAKDEDIRRTLARTAGLQVVGLELDKETKSTLRE